MSEFGLGCFSNTDLPTPTADFFKSLGGRHGFWDRPLLLEFQDASAISSTTETDTQGKEGRTDPHERRAYRLWHRRRIRPWSLLVAAVLERNNKVAAVESATGVPVPFGPAGKQSRFVLALLEHLHEVVAVEFAIQVGVTVPGVFRLVDPNLVVGQVHHLIIVEIELRPISL